MLRTTSPSASHRRLGILLFASAILLSFSPLLVAGEARWEPEKTWIFAVGVLNFDNASLATWPDEGRVDAILLDACRKRGVPADHILFLKNEQATSARIVHSLHEFLRRPGPDDTLLFYYAGHGGRDFSNAARTVSFVTYDTKANWTVPSIFDAIESDFRGSRALLTADCCHSGALSEEAARRKGRIGFGVLTSSRASSNSTGNWTFTQCLVDLVQGNPLLDLNADGQIDLSEAARYIELEMSFTEGQRSSEAATGDFPSSFIFSTAQGRVEPRVGEHCEGLDKGKWYKTKIIAADHGKFRVTWPGWNHTYDAWLTPDQLRPYHPSLLPTGTHVKIEWEKKWYPGSVLQTDLGLLLVHYDGYTSADDEWVTMDRLQAQ